MTLQPNTHEAVDQRTSRSSLMVVVTGGGGGGGAAAAAAAAAAHLPEGLRRPLFTSQYLIAMQHERYAIRLSKIDTGSGFRN